MNDQLRRRLKQIHHADDTKITALAMMFSDAELTSLLDEVERGDYTAKEQRVAYKAATPSAELRRVEAAIAGARLRPVEAQQVLKAWEQDGEAAALGLLAVYKAPGGMLAAMFRGEFGESRDRSPR